MENKKQSVHRNTGHTLFFYSSDHPDFPTVCLLPINRIHRFSPALFINRFLQQTGKAADIYPRHFHQKDRLHPPFSIHKSNEILLYGTLLPSLVFYFVLRTQKKASATCAAAKKEMQKKATWTPCIPDEAAATADIIDTNIAEPAAPDTVRKEVSRAVPCGICI